MNVYDLTVTALRRLYAMGITSHSVLDPDVYFTGARDFRGQWAALQAEADQVAKDLAKVPRFHELLPSQATISANDDRDWRMFILKAYGVPVAGNLALCPALAALLADHPEVLSAALSFLAPGKHIPEHNGPFRGIVRYYLVLRMAPPTPEYPGTTLRIDGQDHQIAEGDHLLWDDTYQHEVWNRSDQIRVALLLDVRRAHLPIPLRVLTRALVAAIAASFKWRLATGRDITVG